MGNKVDVPVKEGNVLEVNETLVRNFQDRCYMMDKSLASFANAIDTMEAICNKLCRYIRNREDNLKVDSKLGDTVAEDTALAETIMECVSDHKLVVLESASKLMHSVIDIGKNFTDCNDVLAIDIYRGKHNVKDIPYYDKRYREMQTEIKGLRQNYQSQKKLVSILNDRENIYVKETEMRKKEMERLRSEIEQLQHIRDDLQTELENQNTKLNQLKQEIKIFHERDKEIHTEAEIVTHNTRSRFVDINSLFEEVTHLIKQQKETAYTECREKAVINDGKSCEFVSEGHSEVSSNNSLLTSLEIFLHSEMEKIRNQLTSMKNDLERESISHNPNISREGDDHAVSQTQGSFHGQGMQRNVVATNVDELQKDAVLKQRQMEEEIRILKLKLLKSGPTKKVNVQVYFEIGVRQSARERDILNVLKALMKKKSIDLQIIEIHTPQNVQADVPLLVIRIRKYGYYSHFQSLQHWHILKEFDDTQNVALVTLHRSDPNNSKRSDDERERINIDSARCFDIGYKSYAKRYDYSEQKVRPVVEFILKIELDTLQSLDTNF